MKKKVSAPVNVKTICLVVFLLILLAAVVKLGMTSYDFGYRVFTEQAMTEGEGKDCTIEITGNMSLMDIAETLKSQGLIRDSRLFWLQVKLSVYKNRIQNGVFTLNTSMTPKEMMQVMSGAQVTQ